MTQSAVSQQIKCLESALGRTLFHRRARGLELTDAARGYLPTVQAAFAMLAEGTTVLTGRNDPAVLELHANLSFAVFWLTPRLGAFLDAHPWIQLNLVTSIWPLERPTGSAAVEVVFGVGKWESKVGQRLAQDQVFPVCTPEIAQRIQDVDGLLRERLIDLPGTLQSWDAWLEGAAQGRTAATPAVHRASTWTVSLAWAQQGLGVALAHDTIAGDLLRSGRLVRPLPFALPMKESYYLIVPAGSETNAAAQAFKVWLLAEMATATMGAAHP